LLLRNAACIVMRGNALSVRIAHQKLRGGAGFAGYCPLSLRERVRVRSWSYERLSWLKPASSRTERE
jgi:hypothetical protein